MRVVVFLYLLLALTVLRYHMSHGFWKIPLNIYERLRVKRQITLYYENSFTFSDLLERILETPSDLRPHFENCYPDVSDWRSGGSIAVSRIPFRWKEASGGKEAFPLSTTRTVELSKCQTFKSLMMVMTRKKCSFSTLN